MERKRRIDHTERDSDAIFTTDSAFDIYDLVFSDKNQDGDIKHISPHRNFDDDSRMSYDNPAYEANDDSPNNMALSITNTPRRIFQKYAKHSFDSDFSLNRNDINHATRFSQAKRYKLQEPPDNHRKGMLVKADKTRNLIPGNKNVCRCCCRGATWPRKIRNTKRFRKFSTSAADCSYSYGLRRPSLALPRQERHLSEAAINTPCLNDGNTEHVTLKNNQIKSSLRQDAMADMNLEMPQSFQQCAVGALSKEDLLVLWKRSEIELQTKLNRVLLQNDHMKRLLYKPENERNADTRDCHVFNENKETFL